MIIDEAHSSQSGETATELKGVLGGAELRKKAQKMATAWRMCDNTDVNHMRLIAKGRGSTVTTISDSRLWRRISAEYGHGD